MAAASYNSGVKTLTVRLPVPLVAEIEAESRERQMSKSDIVRERLATAPRRARERPASIDAIRSEERRVGKECRL